MLFRSAPALPRRLFHRTRPRHYQAVAVHRIRTVASSVVLDGRMVGEGNVDGEQRRRRRTAGVPQSTDIVLRDRVAISLIGDAGLITLGWAVAGGVIHRIV